MFRKSVLAIACAMLLSAVSWGATIVAPAEVKGEVNDWIVVKVTTDSKHGVKWVNLDPSGLKLFPVELLKDSKIVAATSNTAGTYRLLAYTGDDTGPSEPVVIKIIVGGGPNPPPPPVPPTPPDDPFVKSLQAALDTESVADKAKVKSLAALYRQASTTTVNQPSLKTVADLKSITSSAINNLVGSASLTKVRRAIADELNKTLPTTPDTPMDERTRKLCSEQYEKVAKALEVLK